MGAATCTAIVSSLFAAQKRNPGDLDLSKLVAPFMR
jgi:hypothetical protein